MAAHLITYVAVVVLVVIAIVAIDMLLGISFKPHTTSTSTTTLKPKQKTTTIQNSTPPYNYTNTTTGCISSSPAEAILNGNFYAGNFTDWNVTGLGFGGAPVNIIEANANGDYYGAPWSGYTGIYFATTHQPGTNVDTGNLTSRPFRVTEPYINFQIVSPQDNDLYVEILEGNRPLIISHYYTYPAVVNATAAQSTFVNASIPVASLICQNVSIRVVSGVVGQRINNYKFIAVGGFYMSKTPVQTPGVAVNRTVV